MFSMSKTRLIIPGEKRMNQLDVCTHLSNLADLHHDKFVYFGVPLFVVPHLESQPTGRIAGKLEDEVKSL